MLSETIETKLKLAKGAVGELLGVAWKDHMINIDICVLGRWLTWSSLTLLS